MKYFHICCVIIAIIVLFFLLNRVSMYTDDKPIICTCTSSSMSPSMMDREDIMMDREDTMMDSEEMIGN
jgi:hypothetical protein